MTASLSPGGYLSSFGAIIMAMRKSRSYLQKQNYTLTLHVIIIIVSTITHVNVTSSP